ncbi:hypothetical protein D3C87_1017230 [compost metagenome]
MTKAKSRPKLVRVFSHDRDGSCTLPEDVVAVLNLLNYVVITNAPHASGGYFIDVYPFYEVDEGGNRTKFVPRLDPVYYMKEKKSAFAARQEIVKWVRDGCPKQEEVDRE